MDLERQERSHRVGCRDLRRTQTSTSSRSKEEGDPEAHTEPEDIADRAGVHKQTVLRYFRSKEGIALAFRQIARQKFRTGLLNPARTVLVLEYWPDGGLARDAHAVRTTLATEMSREAGLDPATASSPDSWQQF